MRRRGTPGDELGGAVVIKQAEKNDDWRGEIYIYSGKFIIVEVVKNSATRSYLLDFGWCRGRLDSYEQSGPQHTCKWSWDLVKYTSAIFFWDFITCWAKHLWCLTENLISLMVMLLSRMNIASISDDCFFPAYGHVSHKGGTYLVCNGCKGLSSRVMETNTQRSAEYPRTQWSTR